MRSTFLSLSILAVVVVSSCTKHSGLPPKPSNTGIDSSRLVDVRYGRDIKPILTTYCLGTGGQGCHITDGNQFAPGDFTVYQELKDRVDNGLLEIKTFSENANMPPSYSNGPKTFDPTDLAVFKKWVADGAPEN